MRDDAFDLARFVAAQAPVIDQATAELRAGRKRGHWMWFVFPQLAGLGLSDTARRYGIGGLDEARAYLAHAVLGPRLLRCTDLALAAQAPTLADFLGSPDDAKFRSSMTLFERAVEPDAGAPPFGPALARWCGGVRDPRTLGLLGGAGARG